MGDLTFQSEGVKVQVVLSTEGDGQAFHPSHGKPYIQVPFARILRNPI